MAETGMVVHSAAESLLAKFGVQNLSASVPQGKTRYQIKFSAKDGTILLVDWNAEGGKKEEKVLGFVGAILHKTYKDDSGKNKTASNVRGQMMWGGFSVNKKGYYVVAERADSVACRSNDGVTPNAQYVGKTYPLSNALSEQLGGKKEWTIESCTGCPFRVFAEDNVNGRDGKKALCNPSKKAVVFINVVGLTDGSTVEINDLAIIDSSTQSIFDTLFPAQNVSTGKKDKNGKEIKGWNNSIANMFSPTYAKAEWRKENLFTLGLFTMVKKKFANEREFFVPTVSFNSKDYQFGVDDDGNVVNEPLMNAFVAASERFDKEDMLKVLSMPSTYIPDADQEDEEPSSDKIKDFS